MGTLDGRVAIVTGGARGIGRAVVAALASEGADVTSVDIDEDRGLVAASEVAGLDTVRSAGGRATFLQGDVADQDRVEWIVHTVSDEHAGRLDIVVNNAAMQMEMEFLEHTVDDFRAAVDANLLGPFLFTRAAVPRMLEQRRGVIVNISSVLGLVGYAPMAIYSMTKAGLLGLTRSVAIAYADRGIRVVAVCPGDTDTGDPEEVGDDAGARARMERESPSKRFATPDEVAKVVAFLASDDASFINGSHVLVDGGILSRLYQI